LVLLSVNCENNAVRAAGSPGFLAGTGGGKFEIGDFRVEKGDARGIQDLKPNEDYII
jgi:hypothetical protein